MFSKSVQFLEVEIVQKQSITQSEGSLTQWPKGLGRDRTRGAWGFFVFSFTTISLFVCFVFICIYLDLLVSCILNKGLFIYYVISENCNNFKILNKLLNWILSGNKKFNQLLNWILLKNENWINVWIEFVEKHKNR